MQLSNLYHICNIIFCNSNLLLLATTEFIERNITHISFEFILVTESIVTIDSI